MLHPSLDFLSEEQETLQARQKAPLSKREWLAIAIAISAILGMGLQHKYNVYPFQYDLGNYLRGAQGDFTHYYYAYWLLPLFQVLALLPFWVAFILWNLLNGIGIWIAGRTFNRDVFWLLIGYQALYTFFQGNITGITAGSLSLFWIFLRQRRWFLAGIFLTLAMTKFQTGLPLGLLLWWIAPHPWKEKLRAFIPLLLIVIVSLAIYGFWPLQILQSVRNAPPDAQGNITLWQWLGPWALLLPLAAWFVFRKAPSYLFAAWIPCIFLAQPYLQQNDLLLLFLFTPSVFPILGNVGYLLALFDFSYLRFLAFLPLLRYFSLLYAGHWAIQRKA
ncbi:MAG: glycosyltransferase 87 family protein [Anaerolineales bacterium]